MCTLYQIEHRLTLKVRLSVNSLFMTFFGYISNVALFIGTMYITVYFANREKYKPVRRERDRVVNRLKRNSRDKMT